MEEKRIFLSPDCPGSCIFIQTGVVPESGLLLPARRKRKRVAAWIAAMCLQCFRINALLYFCITKLYHEIEKVKIIKFKTYHIFYCLSIQTVIILYIIHIADNRMQKTETTAGEIENTALPGAPSLKETE